MSLSIAIFWGSLALVVYAYAGYPVLLFLRARLRPRPHASGALEPRISLIICAHNEAGVIREKLENVLSLDYPRDALEVIVASDGSTDETLKHARAFGDRGVGVLDLPRRGKIPTLNDAVRVSRGEILVFSDANSMLDAGALRALVAPFSDPQVGGVAGDQRYWNKQTRAADGSEGERAYWDLDRKCKEWQGLAGSVTSATGAVYAIRRSLFREVPPGVTDDFWVSTNVVAQGHRLVFASEAIAREAVTDSSDAEFRRKVRVISRGLRGVVRMRGLLDPRRHGFYALQIFSHKVLRRLVALPLLALIFATPFLWQAGALYRAFAIGEAILGACALLGALASATSSRWGRARVLSIPHYFAMVNAASLVALLNLLRGRRIDVWEPQRSVPKPGGARRAIPGAGWQLSLMALVLLAMGAALALVASRNIGLALLVTLAVPAALALSRYPDLAIPVVAFVLYTNAAVVAVHFHGLPFMAAAAFPMLLGLPIARDTLLRGERLLVTPTFLVLLAFVTVQFVGALLSIQPERSLRHLVPGATEGILLYFLVSNAIRTPKVLKSAVWSLIAAGAFIGAIGAHQQLTGSFDTNYGGFAQVASAVFDTGEPGQSHQPRLAGPIGEKNRFAQIMTMLIPLALFTGMAARTWLARCLALGSLTLILIGASLGFSRGAVVGVAMMFLAMLGFGYIHWRHVAFAAVAVIVTGLAVPQYGTRILSLADVAKAFTSDVGVANADGATRGRLTEMTASALAFADHPLLGVGPGMNQVHYPRYARLAGGKVTSEERRAHSLYPGLAAEHGILGIGFFSAMLFLTLRDLARVRRRWRDRHPDLAAIATALIMVLIVYLTTSLFLHTAYVRYFWFVMALAGATSHLAVGTPNGDRLSPLLVRL
ncbi:MAG: glycosyltransferase [Deltaproteobacteria bacterium]|nr:glycosyltransferase [Deltaproteobacteria bacterium]MBW2360812.1 glycosyltransferase [Deltaproteobacteria bacterium]